MHTDCLNQKLPNPIIYPLKFKASLFVVQVMSDISKQREVGPEVMDVLASFTECTERAKSGYLSVPE